MVDSADPLPTTAREVTVVHPEDTVLVDMAAVPREEVMAVPLVAVREGLARLEVDSVAAEDIAGTSSAKGPVGMMIGMSSVRATRQLCSRSRSCSCFRSLPLTRHRRFCIALLWRCW